LQHLSDTEAVYPDIIATVQKVMHPACPSQGDLLHVLSHPSRPLRHTAGIIITTIVGAEGLASWPELVVSIGAGLSSQEATTLEGVLDTLHKIVEDHPDQVGGALWWEFKAGTWQAWLSRAKAV
jgi:hypothetical protein